MTANPTSQFVSLQKRTLIHEGNAIPTPFTHEVFMGREGDNFLTGEKFGTALALPVFQNVQKHASKAAAAAAYKVLLSTQREVVALPA